MSEEQTPPKKPALSEFVETNSKLVTSLAAFVALTIFSLQQGGDDGEFLAAASSIAAILMVLELVTNLPAKPRSWKLSLFELILVLILFGLGDFWWSRFHVIGLGFLIQGILIVAGLVLFFAACYALQKAGRFFAIHILRMDVSPGPGDPNRPSTLLWVFVTAALYWGIWRIFHTRFDFWR